MTRQPHCRQQCIHVCGRIVKSGAVLRMKLRPRHELVYEGQLVRFQLVRGQETTHLRKVWCVLTVEWNLSHRRIEAVDEVSSRLKLFTAEEPRRHLDAIAWRRHCRTAVVQDVAPAC